MTHSCKHRRGIVLIALMILLAVAGLLVVSWLKIASVERKQLRSWQAQAQAEWLAESALDRAMARLVADADYQGETWKISATELGGRDAGEVAIRVEAVADHPDDREITVQADYPADPERRHRRSKSIKVTVAKQGGI